MIFAMTIAAGMMTTTFAMAQKKASQKAEPKGTVKNETAVHPQMDAAGNPVAPVKTKTAKTAKTVKATETKEMKNEPVTATSKVKAKKAVKAKTTEEKTK